MATPSSHHSQIIDVLQISDKQLSKRATMMLLDDLQRTELKALWPKVQESVRGFVHRLYEQFMGVPELRTVLQHESRVARLVSLQQDYIRELYTKNIDQSYLERRISIGVAHHRIRLSPQWYLAAYAHFLTEHVDLFFAECESPEVSLRRILTFFKLICLDASLILDAYGMCVESVIFSGSKSSDPTPSSADGTSRTDKQTPIDSNSVRNPQSLSRINISPNAAVQRAAFIGLTQEDDQKLATLQEHFSRCSDEILSEFYRFIKGDADLERIVTGQDIERLVSQVKLYWEELLQGNFDESYAASRMRIGVVHEKIGVEPQYYLAGLCRQVVGFLQRLPTNFPSLQGTLRSFFKALVFDLTFVIDSYMESRARTLQQTEHYATNLVRGLACSIVIVDSQRRVIFANENFYHLVGIPPAILFRMFLVDVLPIKQVHEMIAVSMTDGRASHLVSWGGRSLWCTVTRIDPSLSTTRSSLAIIIDDVTEAIAISREMREDNLRFDNLSHVMPAVSWELDLDTRTIVAISSNIREMTAQSETWFLGRKSAWLNIIHPDDVDRFFEACNRLEVGQRTCFDYRIRRSENVEIWVRSVMQRMNLDSTRRISAVTIDVSQEHEAERRRFAAISQLSGGIAHTVNNSLTVIMNNLELLSDSPTEQETHSLVRQSFVACSRVATTVSQLRTFAGQQVIKPKKVSVNATLKERSEFWSRRLHDHVVHIDIDDQLWDVYVDEESLRISLDNLITNAIEAMRFGGELKLAARNLERVQEIEDPGFNREWVELRVSDNGSGMSEEVRKKAVEPFFSTREVQDASGLGLSFVYGFVTQSGGHLLIESCPGEGTEVVLRFPKSQGDMVSAVLPESSSTAIVLLVDDDELVLTSIQLGLEKHGFKVLTAMNTNDALELLEDNRIDSLVADILLREGTDGIQLAKLVAKKSPQAKIVLISGFSGMKLEKEELPLGWSFIAKPFKIDVLVKLLSQERKDDSSWQT